MAMTLIGSNLNDLGNAGNFETDPSTWGMASPNGIITRSTDQKTLGNCSLRFQCSVLNADMLFNQIGLISGNVTSITGGKNYIAKAKIFTGASNQIAADDCVFKIVAYQVLAFPPQIPIPAQYTINSIVSKTVAESKVGFVEIELRITVDQPGAFQPMVGVYPPSGTSGVTNIGGIFFVDEFVIYEYEDAPNPCTLAATVSTTNATGIAAADGSATVAVSAGTPAYEYSKDNGATWQGSNVFSGLLPGVYNIKVREVANISCVLSFSVTVNFNSPAFDWTFIKTDETVIGAADGSIQITPTVADTYNFSFNGGVSYQVSNISPPLAAGTYNVVVKKMSNGALVGKLVTIAPGVVLFEKIYWSKNPIPLSLLAPSNWQSLVNYRKYAEVTVQDVADSGTFVSKMKMILYPNSAGICLFNLRQALRGVFNLVPPSINDSNIVRLTDRIKLFKVVSDDLQNDELTPTPPTTLSNPFLALYGGLSWYAHATSDFFTDLPSNKRFLTWAPDEKVVSKGQEDYLNFLVYGISITAFKLRIKAYFDDATSTTSTVLTKNGVKYGELYQIPSGAFNSGVMAINPAKNVIKYEVSLLNQADSLISEVRTYVIAENVHPLTRYVMVINSLGACEVHLMTGEVKREVSVEKELLKKYVPPMYDALQAEYENSEASFTTRTSYSTGIIKDKNAAAWQAYFTDLLLTTKAYETINGKRYPIAIISKSVTQAEDRAYNKFVRFEAVNGFTDQAYTPQ